MISLKEIPEDSGCYLFKDKSKRIIYIGKAKNLKKRVSSYFTKNNHDNKTLALVEKINSVDFIATSNEIEALILENNLIKKHKPKYNVDLKDSKRFAFLMVTEEDYPRLVLARKKTAKGKYFGPFTSASERTHLMHFLRKVFRLRTCKRIPKKACLRHHINLCDAPCIDNISRSEYKERINNLIMVLKGNTKDIISKLKKDMKSASKMKDFEKAIILREQVNALLYLNEKQNMERQKKYDEDIINYEVREGTVFLIMFNIFKGTLINKREFSFDYSPDFLRQFILRYYSENIIPKEIIVPENVDSSLCFYLEKQKKAKVIFTVPKRGEKKNLLKLAYKNIEISFFRGVKKVEELKKKLKLNESPNVIECFDVSHTSGSYTVGSMVQFRNGEPSKDNYRRFKLRSYEGIDDFKGISELVRRRYRRLVSEDSVMPDLIIIDGGKGQLSFAISELKKLSLNIPIISIAKRDEDIFVPGLSFPIRLSKKDTALQFIQEIRDEAHRFAINYNRLLRSKGARR